MDTEKKFSKNYYKYCKIYTVKYCGNFLSFYSQLYQVAEKFFQNFFLSVIYRIEAGSRRKPDQQYE